LQRRADASGPILHEVFVQHQHGLAPGVDQVIGEHAVLAGQLGAGLDQIDVRKRDGRALNLVIDGLRMTDES